MLRKPIRTKRGCVGHISRNMLTEIKVPIELFLHPILPCSLVFFFFSPPVCHSLNSLISIIFSSSSCQLCFYPQRLNFAHSLNWPKCGLEFLKIYSFTQHIRFCILDLTWKIAAVNTFLYCFLYKKYIF